MIFKNFKKFMSIVIVVIITLSFVGCGSEVSSIEKLKKNGKLVLGTSADFPPYEFHKEVNGKDTIVGFDLEIAKKIAKDLGVELEVKDMKFDGLLAALNQGKVDLVISGMTPTEERRKNVDFSEIYYKSVQTVVVRNSDKNKYKENVDLKNKKLGVQKGAIQEEIAKNQFKDSETVALGKISDLIIALNSNRIDAAIIELPVATSYVKANKDLCISDIKVVNEESGSAVAIKKGNSDLVKIVNETLEKLKKDKLIDKFITEATKLSEQ
ncbi:transporter substrate-binding domain-containing protein [Haloimpatiens sp. FM7315]|uniref:transporter substrate-binding domain-containing protein n=1 Tax=Haloimpatiens sp. FM7315 TaxID=3298609 RepID=UPI0035A3740B